jgi:hypothetical protein
VPLDSGAADATAADAGADARADTGSDARLDAAPDARPAESICDNGLDDDDDGLVDEGCPCAAGATQPCYGGLASQAGVGACALGTQSCGAITATAGTWGSCVNWAQPTEETCNGVDDDCDGAVDEELSEACPDGGRRVCTAGAWSPCEQCNGADDDADGAIDEDLVRACVANCTPYGFQTCESAAWTVCSPGRSFDMTLDRGGIELDRASMGAGGSTDILTFSHTTAAALANGLLVVGIALDQPATVTSVSYAGSQLTQLIEWTADSTFVQLHVVVFYLLAPPAGTADIVIALPAARAVNAGAYTMGNVSGPPVVLGYAKARTTDPLLDVQVAPAGLVIDFLGKEANHGITPAPGNELGWDFCGPGYSRFGSSLRTADGPTTLFWDYECCPDQWILGAVLVVPR